MPNQWQIADNISDAIVDVSNEYVNNCAFHELLLGHLFALKALIKTAREVPGIPLEVLTLELAADVCIASILHAFNEPQKNPLAN